MGRLKPRYFNRRWVNNKTYIREAKKFPRGFVGGNVDAVRLLRLCQYHRMHKREAVIEAWIVEKNQGLVHMILARNIVSKFVRDIPSLHSHLNTTLLHCIRHAFNPWKGIEFSTYAVFSMNNIVRRIRQGEVAQAQRFPLLSTDEIPVDAEVVDPPSIEDGEQIDILHRNIKRLSQREILVLSCRYGLNGRDRMTLCDTGRLIGITKERIRQIQTKAIKKLRAMYEEAEIQ